MGIGMKLIYLEWGYPYDKDIQNAFVEKGTEICPFQLSVAVDCHLYPRLDGVERQRLLQLLEEKKADAVFSINFIAWISDFCQQNHILYSSWVLQLPNMDLLTDAVQNSCNRIAICDSYLVERLLRLGMENIVFLPDAVAECRRVKLEMVRPCCYLGKVPFSYSDTPYGQGAGRISDSTLGYIAGMAHCQRVLYGATMLEDILMGTAAAEFMEKYPLPERVLPQLHRLYLMEAYVAPEVTRLEQIILLQNMSSGVDIDVFTDGIFPDCTGRIFPYKEETQDRLEIYGSTIVNIVQNDRSIHDAIPHQTLEIMASGNFALANFQKDYGYFFQQGETIVCYGDRLERAQLFNEYGMNPEKRNRLCDAAFEAVRAGHTYAHRIDLIQNNLMECRI